MFCIHACLCSHIVTRPKSFSQSTKHYCHVNQIGNCNGSRSFECPGTVLDARRSHHASPRRLSSLNLSAAVAIILPARRTSTLAETTEIVTTKCARHSGFRNHQRS